MVRAMTPLRSLSTARGCARIDSRPRTAKIGPAGRVEVHHARLLAVIGVRKTFPHGLGPTRKSSLRAHIVRFAPGNGLKSDIAGGPFRARNGDQQNSLDDFVRSAEQRVWNSDTECLGGFEVED